MGILKVGVNKFKEMKAMNNMKIVVYKITKQKTNGGAWLTPKEGIDVLKDTSKENDDKFILRIGSIPGKCHKGTINTVIIASRDCEHTAIGEIYKMGKMDEDNFPKGYDMPDEKDRGKNVANRKFWIAVNNLKEINISRGQYSLVSDGRDLVDVIAQPRSSKLIVK